MLFNLTFSEPVQGVGAALISTAASTVPITAVRVWQQGGSARVFAVAVNATGTGNVAVALTGFAAVTDAAGNTLVSSALNSAVAFGECRSNLVCHLLT